MYMCVMMHNSSENTVELVLSDHPEFEQKMAVNDKWFFKASVTVYNKVLFIIKNANVPAKIQVAVQCSGLNDEQAFYVV